MWPTTSAGAPVEAFDADRLDSASQRMHAALSGIARATSDDADPDLHGGPCALSRPRQRARGPARRRLLLC